jgi:FkbM family methyltransferase
VSGRRAIAAVLRPTSTSLATLTENVRPSVALRKVSDRLEWLSFSRKLEIVPLAGLERLGSAYGGYVVPARLIEPEWICYSAGLGEDISFELELIGRCGCTVDAFDPTPKSIEYMRSVTEPKLVFHPYGLWGEDSTQRFYVPRDSNHVSHSIANLQKTDDFIVAHCRSVPSLMAELGHDRLDLLKLDVEGAEYAVLDTLHGANIRPSVVCVDLHRTSTIDEMAAVVRRLQELDLYPVHVYRTDVTLVAARHLH